MTSFKTLLTAAAVSVALAPAAFAEGFIMSVQVEDDDVNIALVIDANSDRPIMELNRFVEINMDEHPWLEGADLQTNLPKGLSVKIEL